MKELNCCERPKKETPSELRNKGVFVVKVTKHQYYTSAVATCKTCGKEYAGNDHPGYHYNYWSWS